jgi:hypothetical protein
MDRLVRVGPAGLIEVVVVVELANTRSTGAGLSPSAILTSENWLATGPTKSPSMNGVKWAGRLSPLGPCAGQQASAPGKKTGADGGPPEGGASVRCKPLAPIQAVGAANGPVGAPWGGRVPWPQAVEDATAPARIAKAKERWRICIAILRLGGIGSAGEMPKRRFRNRPPSFPVALNLPVIPVLSSIIGRPNWDYSSDFSGRE